MTKIDDLLDLFEIDGYYKSGPLIVGNCPIHEGDNQSAWNLNLDEESNHCGTWFCNTKACHKIKGHDIISFVWLMKEKTDKKKYTFVDIIKFLSNFTKGIKVERSRVVDHLSDIIQKTKKETTTKFTRSQVRQRLKIPAEFYLTNPNPRRNFSIEVLDEFDVGLCDDPQSEFYNRVVFPVYEESSQTLVGCVGRAIHNDPRKWINKKGFNKSNHLFGLDKSIKHIQRTGVCILVEGQGDVMRLWEAGIRNAVGIFGASLSDSQEFLLQKTGALTIVIMTDSDEAGRRCRKEIREKLKHCFNIIDIEADEKDIGEMLVEEINEKIKPKLKGLI